MGLSARHNMQPNDIFVDHIYSSNAFEIFSLPFIIQENLKSASISGQSIHGCISRLSCMYMHTGFLMKPENILRAISSNAGLCFHSPLWERQRKCGDGVGDD